MSIQIEYENEDLVVINKPAGFPVYSTKKHADEESVLTWFLEKYPKAKAVGDPERPGVVHRLDKQTSGLLVLAKNKEAFEYLKDLFRNREISKEYLVLVYGEMPKHGIIEKPLTKIGHEGQSRVRVDEKGRESVTEYWAMGFFKRTPPSPSLIKEGVQGEFQTVDTFTLLRIKLHTGRTHQIRVHMASEKHPVMGDNLYGKPWSQKLADILPRQFLHAGRLEFKLMDGTWLEVEAELPEELKKVLSNLEYPSLFPSPGEGRDEGRGRNLDS